jgi:hypothetical protein
LDERSWNCSSFQRFDSPSSRWSSRNCANSRSQLRSFIICISSILYHDFRIEFPSFRSSSRST